MMEKSQIEQNDSQEAVYLRAPESSSHDVSPAAVASNPPSVITFLSPPQSEESEVSVSVGAASRRSCPGRSHDRRSKELPATHHLRALLHHHHQHDASAPAGESQTMVGVTPSRGGSKNSSDAAVPATETDTLSSGDVRNSLASAAPSASASVASLPCMTISESPCDPEAARRRALFEIQRLMLEARPYDSIEFFHVQRELIKYLGLDPQRRASVTSTLPWLRPATAAAGRAEDGTHAPAPGTSSNSGGFWKRLRSRWRRDGAGASKDFKGDGDVNNFEHEVQRQNLAVPDSPTSLYLSRSQSTAKRDAKKAP